MYFLLDQESVDWASFFNVQLHFQFYLLMIINGLHNLEAMIRLLPFAFELKKEESHLIASNFFSLYKNTSLFLGDIIITAR